MNQRWQQIDELFRSAAELPPARRAAFLDSACGSDPELRAEVESLLAYDEPDDESLDSLVQREAEDLSRAHSDSALGRRIGPYRVTAVLGRGGMGVVYRAVREGEFEQEVAIKLVNRGMDTGAILRRFRRERQILARLDHPNVAHLLDGGVTSDGLPYFVMELIAGEPVTSYCQSRRLSVRDRLELFRGVCRSVAYAHQNLVIHRDLKPGNILVTPDGTPKLLDFGLAKVLGDSDTAQTMTAVQMFTPAYASPEQKRGEPLNTATDVYSLGLVLHEVLADPGAALAPELDTIVRKATHEDPLRRYSSVEQLHDDLARYLDGRPIAARKDTLAYRAGKFVRRHRWPVAATVFAVAALSASTAIAVREARRSAARLSDMRELAGTILSDVSERLLKVPGTLPARTSLIGATVGHLDRLAREAPNDPRVRFFVAIGYRRISQILFSPDAPDLGAPQASLANALKAIRLLEDLPADAARNAQLALAYDHAGQATQARGEIAAAFEWYSRAFETAQLLGERELLERGHPPLVSLDRANRAHMQLLLGDPQAALTALGPARGPFSDVVRVQILRVNGDLEGALKISVEALAKGEQGGPYTGPILRSGMFMLAAAIEGSTVDLNLGDPAAALRHLKEASAIREPMVAKDPEDLHLLGPMANLYYLYTSVLRDSDPRQALGYCEKEVATRRRLLERAQENRVYRGETATALARCVAPMLAAGRRADAAAAIREATTLEIEAAEPTAFTQGQAAEVLWAEGRTEPALEAALQAVAMAEKKVAARPREMTARRSLADAYERVARYRSAAPAACDWRRKAAAVWSDWTKWGVSSRFNIRRQQAAERALAACANRAN